MIVSLNQLPVAAKRGSIAIGNFDGVHRGHRVLLAKLKELATKVQGPAVVLTFDPPPSELLRPGSTPPMLTCMERRASIMKSLGIDYLCVCETNWDLLRLTAEAFFQSIVVERLEARAIVEGDNFRFGAGRQGDIRLLEQLSNANGLEFAAVSGELDAEEVISSSRIRSFIERGEIDLANRLLGEAYRLRGRVVAGAARGRTVGFRTANLSEIQVMLPPPGVYAGRVQLVSSIFPAAVHIGPAPTFSDPTQRIEAHIIGFEGDLYDSDLEVELLQRLRDIVKFDSVELFQSQLAQDVARTKELAANSP